MMRTKTFTHPAFATLAMLGVAVIFTPPVSLGQETINPPANPGDRFQIERDGDGFVRLDKKTGVTSFCRRVSDNLVCKLAIEERDIFHSEITDLQDKLAAVLEKLEALRDGDQSLPRPKDEVPDTSHKDGAGSERDKFEQELDRAMDVTKRTMRRLFNMVKELQKEFEEERAK